MPKNNEIMNEMKKKIFFSCLSVNEAVFVDSIEELSEEQLADKSKAYFDGMTLIDCEQDVEDDISQVYSITEDKEHVNLQNYYEKNGAFDEDSGQFLRAIKNLMNREDFYKKDEDDDENEILGIPDFIYIDDRRMLIGESIFSYLLEMDYSDFAVRKELEEILGKTLLSNEDFIKAAKSKLPPAEPVGPCKIFCVNG